MKTAGAPTQYDSLDEAWHAVAKHLMEDGEHRSSRAGDVIELLGYSFRLRTPLASWVNSRIRKASKAYAAAELLWYLSGSNRGAHIAAYAPSYENFLNDGVAYGAYGKRWKDYNQLRQLILTLMRARDSRQAVLANWTPHDITEAARGDKRDIPCTLALQFILRDSSVTGRPALNVVTTMRANDWWLGMPYDVWCFSQVQRLIAAALRVDPGWYQHQVGSLHAYDRNRDGLVAACEEQATEAPFDDGDMGRIDGLESFEDAVATATAEEDLVRTSRKAPRREVVELLGRGSLLAVCLRRCWEKLDGRKG